MQITKLDARRTILETQNKCEKCHKSQEKVQFCFQCHLVSYCNRECQSDHRPKHREVCELLPSRNALRLKEGNFWFQYVKDHQSEIASWHKRKKQPCKVTSSTYFNLLGAAIARLDDPRNDNFGVRKVAYDLGCGKGTWTIQLLLAKCKVYALDPSKEGLDKLKDVANQQDAKWLETKQLITKQGNIENYVFPEKANLVVVNDVLPYCNPTKLRRIWDEIYNALDPVTGLVVGSFFVRGGSSESTWENEGAWFVKDESVVSTFLQSTGFDTIECRRRPKDSTPSAVIEFCAKKRSENYYIHVVQDGAAVIQHDTPKEIQFLYTNGIETCVIIMAKCKNGIILLHDSGILSPESIIHVLKSMGEIEFWTTAANPHIDEKYRHENPETYKDKYGDKSIYETKFERILEIMTRVLGANARNKQKLPEGGPYFSATSRFVCIQRDGTIYTDKKDSLARTKELKNPTLRLRQRINELNNSLVTDCLDCHLQYDGYKYTPIPRLIMPIGDIEELKTSEKEKITIVELLKKYLDEKAVIDAMEMQIRENNVGNDKKVPDAELALRTAASRGNTSEIEFLLTASGVNIDSQGTKSKKTALHQAVENGQDEAILTLLKYGARTDIKDAEGKTAAYTKVVKK